MEETNVPLHCRLCLQLIIEKSCEELDEIKKYMLQYIIPKMDLYSTSTTELCSGCCDKLRISYKFKLACLQRNQNEPTIIKKEFTENGQVDEEPIKVFIKEEGNHKKCCLCRETFEFVDLCSRDLLKMMLDQCFPELTDLDEHLHMCDNCLPDLENTYLFINECIMSEEKIKVYCSINNTNREIKLYEIFKFAQFELNPANDFGSLTNMDIKKEASDTWLSTSGEQNLKTGNDSDEKPKGLTKIKTEPQMTVSQSNETTFVISHKPFPHKILTCPGGLKMFGCLVCNQQMKRKDLLKRHMITHEHPQNIPMFSCDSCSYKTKRKDHLNKHQVRHKDRADIKLFKCDACTYEATSKKGLTSHLISHKDLSEAVIYHCPSCSYQSKWRENISSHKLVHENPLTVTMYSCELCTFKTKRKEYLKTHTITHQNRAEVATFACGLCSFMAVHKYHLKRHMLVHMGPNKVEMFKCDQCPYQAKYKQSVVLHKLTHRDPSEVNVFKCGECPFTAKRKHHLECHMLLHKKKTCEKCDEGVKCEEHFRKMQCGICSFETTHKGQLKRHRTLHEKSRVKLENDDINLEESDPLELMHLDTLVDGVQVIGHVTA